MEQTPIGFAKASVIRYVDCEDADRVIHEQPCPLNGVEFVERTIIENGYVYWVGGLEMTAQLHGVLIASCRRIAIYENALPEPA